MHVVSLKTIRVNTLKPKINSDSKGTELEGGGSDRCP